MTFLYVSMITLLWFYLHSMIHPCLTPTTIDFTYVRISARSRDDDFTTSEKALFRPCNDRNTPVPFLWNKKI